MMEAIDARLPVAGEVLSGAEALDFSLPVRRITPYPYSSNVELIGGEAVPRLSRFSEASIHAAVLLWKAHPEAEIVLIGETPYGDEFPNTTDLMMSYGRGQGVDENAFVPLSKLRNGQPLNNTYTQTKAYADYFRSLGKGAAKEAITMTLAYHLRRVSRPVHAYPALRATRFVAAESVLHGMSVYMYDKALELTAQLHERDLPMEVATLLPGTRRGNALNLAARIIGQDARVVDAIEGNNGGLVLEDDLAMPKLERLLAQARRQSGFQPENG